MTVFKVDLDQLDTTIIDLQQYSTQLDRELAAIDQHVARLQGCWSGQAAAAQAEAHRMWSTGARNLHHSVGVMHQAAATSHANYHGSAGTNQKVWGESPTR